MFEHGDGVRMLVSEILSYAIFEAREKGCAEAWAWLFSEKAVLWAGYLGVDKSRWLSEARKMKPAPKPPKPPKPKPAPKSLPDTPLIRALVKLVNAESTG